MNFRVGGYVRPAPTVAGRLVVHVHPSHGLHPAARFGLTTQAWRGGGAYPGAALSDPSGGQPASRGCACRAQLPGWRGPRQLLSVSSCAAAKAQDVQEAGALLGLAPGVDVRPRREDGDEAREVRDGEFKSGLRLRHRHYYTPSRVRAADLVALEKWLTVGAGESCVERGLSQWSRLRRSLPQSQTRCAALTLGPSPACGRSDVARIRPRPSTLSPRSGCGTFGRFRIEGQALHPAPAR